nr:MAG TPA: restriction alleviation protein [Caudoviricetes sp.]
MHNLDKHRVYPVCLSTVKYVYINGFVSYYVSHSDIFNCAFEIRQQSASETMQEAANKWNRRVDTNDP